MKISIITPSFNSEKYIEDNLRSVHLQQEGNFTIEQIIVDGNSTDNTLAIIKKFKEKYNANIKIIQGKDKNMYDAINKGLKEMTGDIWACLNTDDFYNEAIFDVVIKKFNNNPDIDVLYGFPNMVDDKGRFLYTLYLPKFNLDYFILKGDCLLIFQPATFLHSRVIDKVGDFDINYNYASDYDYFIRVACSCKMKLMNKRFTNYRKHSDAITCKQNTRLIQVDEARKIREIYMNLYNISIKNIKLFNILFYLKQLKLTNAKYILRRISDHTKCKSWTAFINNNLLK
jgi:glycosyltransferase involved in cell wall biosynthesis